MDKHKITFLPENIEILVDAGSTILEAAIDAGLEVDSACGGKGTCGKCKVEISKGTEATTVLACKTEVNGDLAVKVPKIQVSLHRKNEVTYLKDIGKLESGVRKILIDYEEPVTGSADLTRLIEKLGIDSSFINLEALQSLPKAMKDESKQFTVVVMDNQIFAVEPGDTSHRLYGLAIDIGTTTVVATLINLLNGESVTESATNAQITFGADVISRIEYASKHPKGLQKLRSVILNVLNELVVKLARAANISTSDIYLATIVGNTTMNHLFLGLDTSNLAGSPFTPVTTNHFQGPANEVKLQINHNAPVFVFPNIAGYLGGDTVAAVIATQIYQKSGNHLLIDIGTNGEIVLASEGKLLACSTAAGPALEGSNISCGMRAGLGAIEAVEIREDINLKVIGSAAPRGICGSGLLSLVNQLLKAGIVEPNGRMITETEADYLPSLVKERLQTNSEGPTFFLSNQEGNSELVSISQKDIRELQLAKAAIRAGIETLLAELNLKYEDIDYIYLAGAFGNYINKTDAMALGLLPPLPLEKVIAVGNAAGQGAIKALVSQNVRQSLDEIAEKIKHVELFSRQAFQGTFIDALIFAEEAIKNEANEI